MPVSPQSFTSFPAVCIAYSDKFSGVMETIGIESMVADARRLKCKSDPSEWLKSQLSIEPSRGNFE